jgi:cytochrome c oxidase subunit IV
MICRRTISGTVLDHQDCDTTDPLRSNTVTEIHLSDSETIHTHISSPTQLISIFVALLALTGLTVWAATWPVGGFDVWIALGIAGVKATLVAAYFMHLRYDRPTNTLLLIFSISTVVLFLTVTLADVMQLAPEVNEAANAKAPAAGEGP